MDKYNKSHRFDCGGFARIKVTTDTASIQRIIQIQKYHVMTTHPKPELKPVTTQEIVEAIDALIQMRVSDKNRMASDAEAAELRDNIEIARRTIADGLRYHSAAKGVVAGEQ